MSTAAQQPTRRREDQMPSSLDAERTVLGSILLNNDLIYDVSAELLCEHFLMESHRRIYAAMCALREDGKPIDIGLLCEQLNRAGDIGTVGGVAYVASLTEGVPFRANTDHYVRILKSKNSLRKIIATAQNLMRRAMDPAEDVEKIVAEGEMELHGAVEDMTSGSGPRRIFEFGDAVMKEIDTILEHKAERIGLTYGLDNLDFTTTGMRPSETTVAGGRPGAGKSSFALSAAIANAHEGVPVYYASAEMPGESLFGRTLSQLANINNMKIRDPHKLDGGKGGVEYARMKSALVQSVELPLWVDRFKGMHIAKVLSRARLWVRKTKGVEGKPKLCIFDFAQRFQADGKDRFEKVAVIASMVADFARDMTEEGYPTHCMLLSQLKRKETHGKKEPPAPTMEDLKMAGELEENADIVLLFWRREGEHEGKDQIIIAKQRHGPTGAESVEFCKNSLSYKPRV